MAQRQGFRITDFRGGLNPDQNAHQIQDNEAATMLNFRLDRDGSLLSRNGYESYLSLTHSANLMAVGRWSDGKADPTAKVLAMDADGKLLHWNTTGPAIAELLATGTARTVRGDFVPVTDKVVYCDGEDVPIWYDGTTATTLGIDPPASAPTVTDGGAGGITGTFEYAYTYYDSDNGWESNPSATDSITVASKDVDVAITASTDSEVDFIRIYRTTDGGATLLYLAQVANTTGTYTDDGTDTLTATEVDYNNTVPGEFEHMAYHKGYMFGSSGRTLYWSNALSINGWPTTNSTVVPFEGNDQITALVSYQDTLLVFGTNNIISVAGNGGNWTLIRQDVSMGTYSSAAVAEVYGTVVFLTRDGLYTFPGFQPFAPKLSRTISTAEETGHENASLVFVPEQDALWLSLNDQTWVIHVPNQTISLYDFYMWDGLRGGADGLGLPIWIAADNDTDTSRTNIMLYGADSDNGSDIVFEWKSKIFQLANPEYTKYFRRIGAFASSGSSASVTVTINDNENPPYTVDLSAADGAGAVSVFGTAVFGTNLWSFEGLTYLIASLPAVTLFGRTFQVSITGVSNTSVDDEVVTYLGSDVTYSAADVTYPGTIVTSGVGQTEIIPPVTFQYREANRFLGL